MLERGLMDAAALHQRPRHNGSMGTTLKSRKGLKGLLRISNDG